MSRPEKYKGRGTSLEEIAAWLLVLWGCIHVLTLLMTMPEGNIEFSGLLSIVAGHLLLQRDLQTDVQAYRFILFLTAVCVLPLAITGVIYAAVIAQVLIAAEVSINATTIIRELAAALCGLFYWVISLHHPDTRDYFSLKKYESRIWTLYLPLKRFIFVVAGTLLLYGVSDVGEISPALSRDLYVAAIHGIQSDPRVQATVGDVESLVLLSVTLSGRDFDASWQIRGASGKESCRTIVQKDLATIVQLSDEIATETDTPHVLGESDGEDRGNHL